MREADIMAKRTENMATMDEMNRLNSARVVVGDGYGPAHTRPRAFSTAFPPLLSDIR